MTARSVFRIVSCALLISATSSCGGEDQGTACREICLAVTEAFTFTDAEYRYHVTGKVKNFGDRNAEEVRIEIQFFSDSDHRSLLSTESQLLPAIPPVEGWRTFDLFSESVVLLPGEGGLPAVFFEITASGAGGGTEPIPVPDLKLLEPEISTDLLGQYHVQGKIRNEGSIPAEMVYFTVTFYRDEGKTEIISRLRKGFGRFLGTTPSGGEEENGSSALVLHPTYTIDIWHPEITTDRYPTIYYTAEISE